ncbi:MAG: Gfo/Idh/MocA family oxidoreductase [Chloroflexia bacterium]
MIGARGGANAVGIFTLADARPHLIRRALDHGLHVLAEKPLGATLAEEEALLRTIEASDRLIAVASSTATPGTTGRCATSSRRARSASWRSSTSPT